MKKRNPTGWTIILFLTFSLVSTGCNLVRQPATVEPLGDVIYTIAAQTVTARQTQTVSGQVTEEAISIVPTQTATTEATQAIQPSQTLEPSATSIPSETPSPTRIPETIYEDDFTNTNLWYIYEGKRYLFEYQEGKYRIYNKILNGAIWSVREFAYSDIRIEVDAARQGGPQDGYFGVVCRFRHEGEDYYAMVISDTGFYGILKMEDGELEFIDSGIDEQDVIRRGQGASNRIRGVCSGDQLALYVNDQMLLDLQDDSLDSGDVGLLAGNQLSGDGIDVLFDNFAIIRP